MIHGTVSSSYELVIPLQVLDVAGQEQEIETVLDTGFTGSLTLPQSLIASLGLPWRSRGTTMLAGGKEEEFDVHFATIIWDGAPRPVLVQAMDNDPLLGIGLLIGHDIAARVRFGGSVRIEAIP